MAETTAAAARFPSIEKCDLSSSNRHSIAADLDGTLLISRSSFPYFMLMAIEVGSLLRGLILLLAFPLIAVAYVSRSDTPSFSSTTPNSVLPSISIVEGNVVDEMERRIQRLEAIAADYLARLNRAWLLMSQFETRHYSNADVVDDGQLDDCCICLERLHRGLVATLHCRHEFHRGCIGRWLRRGHNFCPLCRHDLCTHSF
ncbi:E3 ubiquitin-protein ligase RNF38-like [Salvia splendens]|uniref:E3 ubiquitin-protein ligase RNF38-like n=1 Tax=Salvia splendens TaxID=180675 RepID=UPI001C26F7FB|nr:E3 ubiquitin-protein ligase RNF38-like [Salvia splendens]